MKLYHFLKSQYGLEAIKNQRYKISTFDDLNDPFELFSVDLANKAIRDAFYDFKQSMADTIGLLCCSKSWNSTLLWSHYADKHRGLALEIDVKDELVAHVNYQKSRLMIDENMMNSLMHNKPGTGVGGIVLKTKSLDWGYEDEARLQFFIQGLNKVNKPYFMPFDEQIKLTGVVLGPLCTTTPEEIACLLPAGKELTIQKSRIAFTSFDIVKQKDFKLQKVHGKA